MFNIPAPEQQIYFSEALADMRQACLQDALSETVKKLSIKDLDSELAVFAPETSLSILAGYGLRGEWMFPAPLVLTANPRLLGYYRLLYGYSQKEFYTTKTGASQFKSMEDNGKLTEKNSAELPELCRAFGVAGAFFLDGIGAGPVSKALLDDLTLLTLGPQLRGGANVRKGMAEIVRVFKAIHKIVESAVTDVTNNQIEIKNAANRRVLIAFASDPDIVIIEEMEGGFRHIIAIEVKGGSDFSNIHNRIGEAEKSHQKAQADGYVECWTIVNVDRIDLKKAKQESPSTNRFYRISDLAGGKGPEYADFRDRVLSAVGVAAAP